MKTKTHNIEADNSVQTRSKFSVEPQVHGNESALH